MTCPALKFDDTSDPVADPAANPACADVSTAPGVTPVGESLFGTFVDEIDIWARQAFAANGFGDY